MKIFNKKKNYAISILVAVVLLYLAFSISRNYQRTQDVFVICKNPSTPVLLACIQDKIFNNLSTNPVIAAGLLNRVWEEAKNNNFAIDLRIFSPVAHEVGMKLYDSKTGLKTAINYCGNSFKDACVHGALMEYIDANYAPSDGAVGQIIFDCTKVAENYKHTCYASLGSYKQYEANSEPWQETFKFCASLPDIYKNDCFAGADERLLMALGGDNRQIEKICNFLLFEEKNGCLMTQKMSLNSLQ